MNIEQGMSKEEGCGLSRFPLVAKFLPEKQACRHVYNKERKQLTFLSD
jgi:hypothetical protein